MAYKHKTVRGLLRNSARWTKYVLARDTKASNRECRVQDGSCFCLIGALIKVYPAEWELRVLAVREAIYRNFPLFVARRGYKTAAAVEIHQFNDSRHRTLADVQLVAREAKV